MELKQELVLSLHAFDDDFFNIRQPRISANPIERLPRRNILVGAIEQSCTSSWGAATGDAHRFDHPPRAVFLPHARAISAIAAKEPRHDLSADRIAADDLRSAGQLAVFAVYSDFSAEKTFI